MIGFFDSGVGGMSIVRELRKKFSKADFLYYADTKHMPYGKKSKRQLKKYVHDAVNFLESQNVELIVDACNTASIVLPKNDKIVGMIKRVGEQLDPSLAPILIVATEATIRSGSYQNILERKKAKYFALSCGDLAKAVEKGDVDRIKEWGDIFLQKIFETKARSILLGCTHYSLVKDILLGRINENGVCVEVIDPAVIIASSVCVLNQGTGKTFVYITGVPIRKIKGMIFEKWKFKMSRQ